MSDTEQDVPQPHMVCQGTRLLESGRREVFFVLRDGETGNLYPVSRDIDIRPFGIPGGKFEFLQGTDELYLTCTVTDPILSRDVLPTKIRHPKTGKVIVSLRPGEKLKLHHRRTLRAAGWELK